MIWQVAADELVYLWEAIFWLNILKPDPKVKPEDALDLAFAHFKKEGDDKTRTVPWHLI